MNGLIHSSLYFGMLVSVGAYMLGVWLKKKTGWAILNPLLVAIIVVIAFLSVFLFFSSPVSFAKRNN